jgi:ferredoxin-NADP reductase/ferredoxin
VEGASALQAFGPLRPVVGVAVFANALAAAPAASMDDRRRKHGQNLPMPPTQATIDETLPHSATKDARACATSRGVLCLLAGLLWALCLHAQSPEEHASHHPAAAGAGAMPSASGAAPGMSAMPAAGASPAPSRMGSMMEGMGDMMKGMMGGGRPKEIYPSLMALPVLSPEQRKQIEEQADERMHSGAVIMGQALDALNAGTKSGDYAAMHEATTTLREGIAQIESGIAARRALAEGRAPREVALAWFKREMNLSLGAAPVAQGLFGVMPFHLFTMVLLVAFALAMVVMYFLKMRRAAALFGRIEEGKGVPPPGAAPELAGGKSPSGDKTSDDDKPPPRGSPSSGGKRPPAAPNSPAAPPVPAPWPGGSTKFLISEANSPPPLTANWRGQLRVGSIITETPSVKTFWLLPSSSDRFLPFIFVPGQFRMNRSYSISSSPLQREYVDLTVRREPRGAVSRHIVDLLKVGDKIEAGGPVGKFTFTGKEADSIVLISGGVGITPMVSISRYLTEQSWPGDIFFIYACRTPADYILANEIAVLQRRNPKLHVVITMTRPEGTDWKGPRGHLTKELLTQSVPDLISRRIHLCGPIPMMDATKALLAEMGVPSDQLKTEAFGTPKPSPAAAGTTARPAAPATGPLVTFSKNNKSAKTHVDLPNGDSPPQQTILELSEELGIGIEFSCRVGTCGVCKVKMTSGEVDQAVQDALDDDDKANGIILACQAKPKEAVTVEA